MPIPPPLDDATRLRSAFDRAPLFAGLPAAALDDLAGRAQLRRAGAGAVIVAEDDDDGTLFVIAAGRVKQVVVGDSGREVTLAVLRAGDVFGEVSLFDGKRRPTDCIAIEPTQLVCLGRDEIVSHLAAHPRTALNLLGQMAGRLRNAGETIALLALCDVNERLVRQIVALARLEGSEAAEGLLVRRRPTQQELASMVGSCRETISRAFNQLARDGLIIPRGRAMVVTHALLERGSRARGG